MPHRNSQKRKYIPGRTYFITTKTFRDFPYFEKEIFCELLIMELKFCQKLLGFEIYAHKINPDHIHLLLCPNKTYNYSKIMQFVKRHFTRNCNIIMEIETNINKGDNGHCRLYKNVLLANEFNNFNAIVDEFDQQIQNLKKRITFKYGEAIDIPRFRWQKSFHYHCITSEADLINHIQYIRNQAAKHNLIENKYCYIDNKLTMK